METTATHILYKPEGAVVVVTGKERKNMILAFDDNLMIWKI